MTVMLDSGCCECSFDPPVRVRNENGRDVRVCVQCGYPVDAATRKLHSAADDLARMREKKGGA